MQAIQIKQQPIVVIYPDDYGICYRCEEESVVDENDICHNCQPREEGY